MTALSVRIEDHSQRFLEMLDRKIRAGMGESARLLADNYQQALQQTVAPPHSNPGQIPHAYLGHKPGGFGPLAGYGEIQNITKFGFSRDQTEFLSDYIRGTASAAGQSLRAFVGFADSHVTRRDQNYLLRHDRTGRPWVMPVYQRSRQAMITGFRIAFRETP